MIERPASPNCRNAKNSKRQDNFGTTKLDIDTKSRPVRYRGAEKKDVKSNKPFCEALVNNLQFISEGMRLGLAVDGGYAFRNTIIYDARPSGELDKIERPPQLTKDDCDELVANYDYRTGGFLAALLGLRLTSGGPWLIAIDPVAHLAIGFDFAGQREKYNSVIGKWTEVLQNPTKWRNKRMSLWSYFLNFKADRPHIVILKVPSYFPH